MAAPPLLPDNIQQLVADFQREVRYTAGLDERPTTEGDVAPPAEPTFTLRSTPTPTPRPNVTPESTPTPRPATMLVLLASATPRPTFTPRAAPTPAPRSGISDERLDSLRNLALQLINRDRADHGLPPVVLGTNPAAQLHAEDMLAHDYQGHWWVDGRKPYMVYTQTGGTSYAAENAASSGWTDREWRAKNCGSLLVRCTVSSPTAAITELQRLMMYDDAHADWGHRDNILGESHRAVNIGIASNGRRTTFIQHFEGGAIEADGPPVLNSNGVLSFSLAKRETGVAIGAIVSVSFDPPPAPKTPQQIDALDSYCVGGGFTPTCPDSDAATVLKPLGAGYHYSNLDANEVVANSWTETADAFSFAANVGRLMQRPGVYTVIIWRDNSGGYLSEILVELSLFVE